MSEKDRRAISRAMSVSFIQLSRVRSKKKEDAAYVADTILIKMIVSEKELDWQMLLCVPHRY